MNNNTISKEELEKARRVVTTGRGLVDYEKRLNFNRNQLGSKTILDLGAGVAQFDKELADYFAERNDKPQIVALDVAYDFQGLGFGKEMLDQKIKRIVESHPENISIVPGVFSKIPFPDNFFDYVFSLYAFPLHIRDEEYFEIGLLEIIRVLKKGGIAKLAPLEYHKNLDEYYTYGVHTDHFETIFNSARKKCDSIIHFMPFKSGNISGLEIRKR